MPGLTGENLLQLLEMRLDNIVYRLGFTESRNQARQLVLHGHIALNGRRTNIPSCHIKPGDIISWIEKSSKLTLFITAAEDIKSKTIPDWLSVDQETLVAKVVSVPIRSEMDMSINEQLIVEFYAR